MDEQFALGLVMVRDLFDGDQTKRRYMHCRVDSATGPDMFLDGDFVYSWNGKTFDKKGTLEEYHTKIGNGAGRRLLSKID